MQNTEKQLLEKIEKFLMSEAKEAEKFCQDHEEPLFTLDRQLRILRQRLRQIEFRHYVNPRGFPTNPATLAAMGEL